MHINYLDLEEQYNTTIMTQYAHISTPNNQRSDNDNTFDTVMTISSTCDAIQVTLPS